jgi:hypothetical protein
MAGIDADNVHYHSLFGLASSERFWGSCAKCMFPEAFSDLLSGKGCYRQE